MEDVLKDKSSAFPLHRERAAPDESETLTTRRQDGTGAGYGVTFTSAETAHKRYKSRRKMIDLKMKVHLFINHSTLF